MDPWAEAEARVDPLRKANLKELNDRYPMEGEDPRLALGRWMAKPRISPTGAEKREAGPESRRMADVERIRTKTISLEEVRRRTMVELFGMR